MMITVTAFPPPHVPLTVETALIKIDADADAIYAAVVGNRAAEYEASEREALAYISSGYTGNAPPMVDAWAVAKGWTGAQAADDMAMQAAAWRQAQAMLRAQRLAKKEQVRKAADIADVYAALTEWGEFVAAVRQQLGL